MRTTVTQADEMIQERLEATGTDNRAQAVCTAVPKYLRRRLVRLRALRGKIGILSNEEIEAAEMQELDIERA